MRKNTHINVTVDFSNWGDSKYDLRIPVHQPIKQLLMNLIETLNIDREQRSLSVIKVATKGLLLADGDSLIDYSVVDGDTLIVL